MRRTLEALAIAGATSVAWALFERHWYTLRHQTVPALRPGGRGMLRVLHLSDLHMQPHQQRLDRFVRACADRAPDLIVVTGDIVGHADAVEPAIELLGNIVAGRQGVVVLGSSDRFAPVLKNPLRYFRGPSEPVSGIRLDTDRLIIGLKEAGWHVLINERMTLDTAVGEVDVVGLDDPHIGAARPSHVDWSPTSSPSVALRLGVVHAPYMAMLDHFADAGYDITLAGHTHGGQLRLPGFGALVDNCDLPLGQARGLSHHRVDDMWLHVSAGLGTSRYAPIRFACRPEASMIDIVAPRPRPNAEEPAKTTALALGKPGRSG